MASCHSHTVTSIPRQNSWQPFDSPVKQGGTQQSLKRDFMVGYGLENDLGHDVLCLDGPALDSAFRLALRGFHSFVEFS